VSTKIKIDVGRELIHNGLIKTNKKFDEKKGTISMNLEQNVSARSLPEHTGNILKRFMRRDRRKLNIQDEIRSNGYS